MHTYTRGQNYVSRKVKVAGSALSTRLFHVYARISKNADVYSGREQGRITVTLISTILSRNQDIVVLDKKPLVAMYVVQSECSRHSSHEARLFCLVILTVS